MGEEQFIFSNKAKAKKWLVTFENNLNEITQELIQYVPKLFSYNAELSLYMKLSEQEYLRNELNTSMQRYWLLYNSQHTTSIGREINFIFNTCEHQLKEYKNILGKNNRNQNSLKKIKIDIKHLKYLRNEIDALFDTKNTLKTFKNSKKDTKHNVSEKYLRIA